MAKYLQERQASETHTLSADSWLQQIEETLNDRVLTRSWKAGGIRSRGSLRYFLGDFDFDYVTQWDAEKKNEQKWLGRCGCVAHYVVLQAARNGFSDVRMYFAQHPKAYGSICPLTMHYYAVIGRYDADGDSEQYWILDKDGEDEKYQFKTMSESELVQFMQEDYESNDVSLCMQSRREVSPQTSRMIMAKI